MSKSLQSSSKLLIPVLAVAVIGMGAMVATTANLQNSLNLNSKAAAQYCTEIHDSFKTFDTSFWAKVDNGTVTTKDGKLSIIQPASGDYKYTSIVGKSIMFGDFNSNIVIDKLKVDKKEGTGQFEMALWSANNTESIWVNVAKLDKGYILKTNFRKANNTIGTEVEKERKDVDFPLKLRIERKDDDFKVYYDTDDNGNNGKLFAKFDDLTSSAMKPELKVRSQEPGYPTVEVLLKTFNVNCNFKK